MVLGSIGQEVSDALTGIIKGAGDVSRSTIDVVKSTLVNGFQGARDVVKEDTELAGDTVAGAIQSASKASAEQVLEESEERYRTLLNTVGDAGLGIVVIQNTQDEEATIAFSNTRLCDMLGCSEEELIGKSVWNFVSPENIDLVKERYRKRQKGEDVVRSYEVLGLRKDGKRIPVEIYISATTYDGKPATVAYIKDITERKQLEKERERAERLDSIGLLAGGIAHDFNNYLTSIVANVSIARKSVESGDIAGDLLSEAEEAATQAKDLTQQLLTFARGGAPIKKTVIINKLIEDTTKFALRGSNVKPEFFMPDDLWPVEVDESQMRQVISNLIINASEATSHGGTVRIKAENYPINKNDYIPLPHGRYIELSFIDDGIGIPEEHLTHVFDPYFTTKKKGSGLGMATVYSIIKAHGGHIDVESRLGSGTTFRIFLPVSNKPISRARRRKEVTQLNLLNKSRILVMDDNKSIRKMLEIALGMAYEVALASDGAEALELYAEARKNGQPFDIVIMDLTIPGGIGGKEAIHDLLKIDPDATVIVSSGYSNDPIMSRYKEHGFKGMLGKPYNIDELRATIENLLKRRKVQKPSQ